MNDSGLYPCSYPKGHSGGHLEVTWSDPRDVKGPIPAPTLAALDRLDAALAEMTPEKWEPHVSTLKTVAIRGQDHLLITVLNEFDGIRFVGAERNAAGIALIRNMASALSTAVRAAEALRKNLPSSRVWTQDENAIVVALAAVAAAGEES